MSRLIDSPSMYKNNSTELALELICTFPDGTDESLVWRKYARDDDDVHRIGCDKERRKRIRKPDTRYKGCGTTTAGQIRGCRNARGHGLSVQHAPEEGIHHAAVAYAPASGLLMQKSDRTELKLSLGRMFSNVNPHACPDPQPIHSPELLTT